MKIEKYDNIKPPEKIYERNTNGKILYIRHGKTEFNYNKNLVLKM